MNEEDIESVSDDEEEVIDSTEDRGDEVSEDRGDVVEAVKEEVEEVVEEVVAEKAEEKEEDEEKPRMIPKSRFDEVNNKYQELKERYAEIEQSIPTKKEEPKKEPEASVEDLELKAAEALMEGDVQTYSKIQKQIRDQVVAEAESRAEARVIAREAAAAQKAQETQYAEALKEVMKAHPELGDEKNHQSDIDDVAGWRDVYFSKGMSSAEALRAAAKKVFGSAKEEPTPVVETKKASDPRKAEAVARGAKVSSQQPPSLQVVGAGNRSSAVKLDPEAMDEDEFAALPVAEKRKLRGD